MSDFVNLDNTAHRPTDTYGNVISQIQKDGVCPFCPESLAKYHKNPILKEGKFTQFVKARYASFDSGFGRDIEKGRLSFRDLDRLVRSRLGEPAPRSGQQEFLENLLNSYLHG